MIGYQHHVRSAQIRERMGVLMQGIVRWLKSKQDGRIPEPVYMSGDATEVEIEGSIAGGSSIVQ
jgi:hypothetical protein